MPCLTTENYQKKQLDYCYVKLKEYNRLFLVERLFMVNLVNGVLNKWKSKRVLDIGCGKAEYAPSNLFFVGIDPSKRIFDAKKDKNTNYVRSIGENLPLINANFDLSLLLATLDHLAFPKAVLREILRILKPNGHLIIILGNNFSLRNRLRRLRITETQRLEHIHFFSTKDVLIMLKKLGFKIIRLESFSYLIITPKIQNLLPLKSLVFLNWIANKIFSIILPYESSYFLIEGKK